MRAGALLLAGAGALSLAFLQSGLAAAPAWAASGSSTGSPTSSAATTEEEGEPIPGKVTTSPEDANSVLTPDSDGFFAALSDDGKATFDTKIGLSDLEKFGISVKDGVKVTTSGSGSLTSPATSGSTTGASISYSKLVTITIDQDVFERAAQLAYVNNNGKTVSYNKRDTIQAVLYAIGKTTQASGFDGKTMYQVDVDYDGTIDLTNTIFVYSSTWLKLGPNTIMRKEFQSDAVKSDLGNSSNANERANAENRKLKYTNDNILRSTASEYSAGGYGQCENIVIDGGTWDVNLENYNSAKLGTTYQSSSTKFSHMKNLVVQNASFRGANYAHHLELSGIRDVTVSGCSFTDYDGAGDKEAIQVETLHSKGSTRECEPFDDTLTRNVVVYDNYFADCSRGVGNHGSVLGLDSTRIFVYRNRFENLSAQCVLTVGCRSMRIEDNTMTDVGTGVDVRVTKLDNGTNVSFPHAEYWTYDELVDDGFLNRNIKIVNNTISTKGASSINAADCRGVAISVKGQTIAASSVKTLTRAAGSYTISGVTVTGNHVTSATGTGLRFYNTKNCTLSSNTVDAVNEYSGRGIGLYVTKSSGLKASGNTFANSAKRGAYLTSSESLTLSGNTFASAGSDGIYASSVPSLTLEKNALSGIGGNGIYATGSKNLLCSGNELGTVAGNGISLNKSKSASISANDLTGIAGRGVYLAGASTKAKVTGNVLSMSKGMAGVYAAKAATGTKATGNRIVTSGATALDLRGVKTPAFIVSKLTRKKVTGTAPRGKTVSAYVSGKKVGSAKSAKTGKFTVKFKKKLAKNASLQLRYTDASSNSIRTNRQL